jgi:hypothetical protein
VDNRVADGDPCKGVEELEDLADPVPEQLADAAAAGRVQKPGKVRVGDVLGRLQRTRGPPCRQRRCSDGVADAQMGRSGSGPLMVNVVDERLQ